ncbi:MAG TPA: hypothetical protein DCG12_01030 [Planctomycetaceae bacterium]|nr:hypothetical protein [Planctomycetaceae bacterium]
MNSAAIGSRRAAETELSLRFSLNFGRHGASANRASRASHEVASAGIAGRSASWRYAFPELPVGRGPTLTEIAPSR